MTLYPIVTIENDYESRGQSNAVCWWQSPSASPDIRAYEGGVFVFHSPILGSRPLVAEFCAAVQEAWDAVAAIRHGTSLERFPRDLTAISEATSAET